MQESGHLHFIETTVPSPFPNFDIDFASGHTEKMMIPKIRIDGKTICYISDLLPSVGHIPLAYVMGYDVALVTLEEKESF